MNSVPIFSFEFILIMVKVSIINNIIIIIKY